MMDNSIFEEYRIDSFTVNICTTSPEYHQQKCSSKEPGFGTELRACNTGLRVYEGAKLLAEFFRSSSFLDSNAGNKLTSSPSSVLELGCGCALAGITLAATFPSAAVALTDASNECVALVAQSIVKNIDQNRSVYAKPLWWGAEEIAKLKVHHGCVISSAAFNGFDLVIGSDLLYFMVDVNLLANTCVQAVAETGWIFLAHFMRIPDGQRTFRSAATNAKLRIAKVNPSCIFIRGAEEQQTRGWGGLELVVLRQPLEDPTYSFSPLQDRISLESELNLPLECYGEANDKVNEIDSLLTTLMLDDLP